MLVKGVPQAQLAEHGEQQQIVDDLQRAGDDQRPAKSRGGDGRFMPYGMRVS
jgi:hypothetical protein